MSLYDRMYGWQFSEVEKEFLFNRGDTGYVRYDTPDGRFFYLDPSLFLKASKSVIYCIEGCNPPPEGECVEVAITNEKELTLRDDQGIFKITVRSVCDWKIFDPTPIALRTKPALDQSEFIEFFQVPFIGEEDIIGGIGLCSALRIVSAPPSVLEGVGGINTAVLGKSQPWMRFKKIMGVIPSEFSRATAKYFYDTADKERTPSHKRNLEVNLTYRNPKQTPMDIPIPLVDEIRTGKAYLEEIEELSPFVTSFMLDALMLKPGVPSGVEDAISEGIYQLREDYYRAGRGPTYMQNLGEAVPKLSLALGRLQRKLEISNDDVHEAVDLWGNMYWLSTKILRVGDQLDLNRFYQLSADAKKLYYELIDFFGIDIAVPLSEARQTIPIPKDRFEDAFEELNMKGVVVKYPSGRIKVLDLQEETE